MDQVERTARLIRSKGVGIYFVTQAPTDVPASVLAQLGNRVQHALRAFTPDDADALRKTARTFPMTDFYDVEKTITSLGTGEALVTVLTRRRGVPTPLAATRLLPPDSLMAPMPPDEFAATGGGEHVPDEVRPDRRPRQRARAHHGTARGRAAAAAVEAATRAGLDPTTAGWAQHMTPAQQAREIARQQKAIEAAEVRAAARGRAAAKGGREGRRGRRESAPEVDRQALRTGGKVVTSRLGQDIVRGVFGVLFGGGKSR